VIVDGFGWCFPAERLARSAVEGDGDGEVAGNVVAEVGAFGEVLTQQPVDASMSRPRKAARNMSADHLPASAHAVSDRALMDVAPARARAVPQRSSDGVVGLFVVGVGVLVVGVVGAGDPAAG
jgi:hypothetical protein